MYAILKYLVDHTFFGMVNGGDVIIRKCITCVSCELPCASANERLVMIKSLIFYSMCQIPYSAKL